MPPAGPVGRMDQFQTSDALLKYIYSGAIGATKGYAVDYALMHTTADTITFSVALELLDDPPKYLDRYQIIVDRQSGEPSSPTKIEVPDEVMQEIILAATGRNVASSERFTGGGFSTSYKVTVMGDPEIFVVQLRFHGNVASMDVLMRLVHTHSPPGAVPIPTVYSIPGEAEYQQATGLGRQIRQFIPGIMAERVYPDMPHAKNELIAKDNNGTISLAIGPDRHFALGGPFASVSEWLKTRLRHSVASLARANGIDNYKEKYMADIQSLIDNRLDQIPKTVEDCPVVALHVDIGLHNVIVSDNDHADSQTIIDWELCASAPFLTPHTCLEMLFRRGAPNGFGAEYPKADQLRDAFWNAIPKWKAHWESQGAKDCMEWLRFALFMQPEYAGKEKSEAEKWEFWAENVRVVEAILKKYGEDLITE